MVCCGEKDALVGNTDIFIKRLENQKLSKGTILVLVEGHFSEKRWLITVKVTLKTKKDSVKVSKTLILQSM